MPRAPRNLDPALAVPGKKVFLLLLIILINVTLGALIILVLSLINYLSIFYCEINKI